MNSFDALGLNPQITKTLSLLGYESPTPIQTEAIPVFLQGGDLIAQAQTGTGKTAAFALPIVEKIDLSAKKPQALILAPTRELAIQVAEALKSYSKHLANFHVLPIYGGQEYRGQLMALKRGVHVVVGTPGRVMDHMRRGTLQLDELKTLVLDEADEMLKMGFIDDIEWILEHTPTTRQIALFSATMPPPIQKVANNYLQEPSRIQIAAKTKTVALIEQGCVFVSYHNKLEALTRFLETENFDAIMIFTRTKLETVELAEKLAARGFSVDALNGDVRQSIREKIIQRLKNKSLDIVVATEVAARGLDVDRIDLVINYDIPTDPESYVHRIGRTGRAGRSGKAITFITPRERGLLGAIERTINARIEQIQIPSLKQMHEKRVVALSENIVDTLEKQNLDVHRELIERISNDSEYSALDIAAALTFMLQGEALSQPETHDDLLQAQHRERDHYQRDERRREHRDRGERNDRHDRGSNERKRFGDREKRDYGHDRKRFDDKKKSPQRYSDEKRPGFSHEKPAFNEEKKSRFSSEKPSFKKEVRKEDSSPVRKKRLVSRKQR